MKIALAQLNPVVGDLDGNLAKLEKALARAAAGNADLLVLPELFLTGYPPRDLLERPAFTLAAESALEKVAQLSAAYPATALLVGGICRTSHSHGRALHNAAFLFAAGRRLFTQAKTLLPSYDVFDETRYFEAAAEIGVFPYQDEVLGISICEDAWNEKGCGLYPLDPLQILKDQGATLLLNLSASPYHLGKEEIRAGLLRRQCRRLELPLFMVNQVGGNDELIFDGGSLVLDGKGEIRGRQPQFVEDISFFDSRALPAAPAAAATTSPLATLEAALVLGIRDYFYKCGFRAAVIGLSGGIDSALTAALAVSALGAEQVRGLTMPSLYSSGGSVADSLQLAENLGIRCDVLPISDLFQGYRENLAEIFAGRPADLSEENLQARIRGTLLMAVANKFNRLLLATGNKSEMAVGYCTLYGDMCGGLAPISDLPKGLVYELARYLNRDGEIIPAATIYKEPSAELRPEQKDSDSLPPYEQLDRVLELYIDEALDESDIIRRSGYEPGLVRRIITLVKRNEYKRRQAPPGLKVSGKAFGCGRRMPIAAKF